MKAQDLLFDWVVEQDFGFRCDLLDVLINEFSPSMRYDIVMDELERMTEERLTETIEYAEELRDDFKKDDIVYDDGEMGLADIKMDDERMEGMEL